METGSNSPEAAVYRLLRVPGLDAEALSRVLSSWSEQPAQLDRFWGRPADGYRATWGLSQRAARFLQDADEDEEATSAEQVLLAAREADIELVSVLDPWFASLGAARGLPPVLFTRGNQDFLWGSGVTIPHSRDASEEALDWGAALARALAEAGIGLVTGHNRDGYRRAAAAAKRFGAPLTVVLDRPLHGIISQGPSAEPVSTARLWDERFRPERELLVSALPPGARWLPAHARGRDSVIVDLAEVVAAGDVRAGGNIAGLCAAAAAAGRGVYRSPFCRAEFPAPVLPSDADAAAGVIQRAMRQCREVGSGASCQLARPQPGWLERRWAAEAAALIESLEPFITPMGWAMRCPLSSLEDIRSNRGPDTVRAPLVAIVQLPAFEEGVPEEAIFVGRQTRDGDGPGAGEVLLLSPGEPIVDLAGLRAYLSRCRERLKQAFRSPPR